MFERRLVAIIGLLVAWRKWFYLSLLGKSTVWFCLSLFATLLAQAPQLAAARLESLGAAQAFVNDTSTGAMRPLPLLKTHVSVTITGSVADVVLAQTFRNDSDDWINVVYAVPVSDTSVVHGWELTTDGRKIRGVVRERQAAARGYQEALSEGRQAALLEPIADDLFHIKVANIPPWATLTTELKLVQPLSHQGRTYRLQLPTTLAPRYQPLYRWESPYRDPYSTMSSSGGSAFDWLDDSPSHQWGVRRTEEPQHPLTWDIRLIAGTAIQSVFMPLHRTQITRQAESAFLTNTNQPAQMDRDLVVVWTLADSHEPTASIVTQEVDGEWFGVLDIHEPIQPVAPVQQPRELILVVDVSGSMSGAAIRQAKEAARTAITNLTASDTFNVIAFDHRVFSLFDQPNYADAANRQMALNFIDDWEADGGTEMLPALGFALEQSSQVAGVLAQIVFVTDGAIHSSTDLLALIESGLGATRLSTVAIGAAPNTAFMRRAAAIGGGMFRQVSTMREVRLTLEELIYTLSQPMLTDITIDWPPGAEPAGASLRDLYVGEPLRVPVRFSHYPMGYSISVRGRYAGIPWHYNVPITTNSARSSQTSSLAVLWAGATIQSLLDHGAFAEASNKTLRNDILPLALAYGVASPFTAFLAEELSIARPPSLQAGDFTVTQQSPAQEFVYPQTATQLTVFIYVALFSLFWLLIVIVMRRDDERR